MIGKVLYPVIGAIIFAALLNPGLAQTPAPEGDWKKNLNKAQVDQMQVALQRGQTKAQKCFTVVGLPARGEVSVDVVFDGQKGRVTDVMVHPPYADEGSERCIKRGFVGEIIVLFDGPPRQVSVVFAPSAPR
jgi:hypothetical protein